MKRLCIFIHWDRDNIIDAYIITYIQGLQTIAADIIFVSNCQINEEEKIKIKPFVSSIVVRENKGLDFGAWKQVILSHGLSSIADTYDELVLANSSCFAPLFPFQEMFDAMKNKNSDFWGITENTKSFHRREDRRKIHIPPHIQSYFLVFNKKVMQSVVFDQFWRDFDVNQSKDSIIIHGETTLTPLLVNAGFQASVYIPSSKPEDLSIFFWSELIQKRCPTLKVKIFSIFTENRPYRLTELFNYQTLILKAGSKYSCLLIDAFLKRSYPSYIKSYSQYIKNPALFTFISMPIKVLHYAVTKVTKFFVSRYHV